MNEELLLKTYELKEALDKDQSIILLSELNKRLEESYEVHKLADIKDKALIQYEQISKCFSEDSVEMTNVRKELKEAKEALNNHPLVKQYLEVYGMVREIYMFINQEIFSLLDYHFCHKKHLL